LIKTKCISLRFTVWARPWVAAMYSTVVCSSMQPHPVPEDALLNGNSVILHWDLAIYIYLYMHYESRSLYKIMFSGDSNTRDLNLRILYYYYYNICFV